jgi:hypothetical protein
MSAAMPIRIERIQLLHPSPNLTAAVLLAERRGSTVMSAIRRSLFALALPHVTNGFMRSFAHIWSFEGCAP